MSGRTYLLGKRGYRGVTVLELLVAVSIFSIIITIVFSVYMRAQNAVRSGMGRGVLEDAVRLVLRRFTSDLRSAAYLIEGTDTSVIYITRRGTEVEYRASGSQLLIDSVSVFRPPRSLEAFTLEYLSENILLDADGDSTISFEELDLNGDGVLSDREDTRETRNVDMIRVFLEVSEGKVKATYRTATRLMNLQGEWGIEE